MQSEFLIANLDIAMTNRISHTIYSIITISLLSLGCSDQAPATPQKVSKAVAPINSSQSPEASSPVKKQKGPHGSYDPHASLGDASMIKVALQHQLEGRPELAMQTLAEAIDRYPQSAQVYAVRASLLLQANDVSGALQDLEKAVTLAPDDASIRVNRAQAYRSFGRNDEAMSDLNHAVSVSPDLMAARFNRGVMYVARNEFDKALLDFDQCIAIDPHTAGPYFNRASTYYSLGRKKDAVADLKHFLKLTDNDAWKKSAQDLLKSWQDIDADKTEEETSKKS